MKKAKVLETLESLPDEFSAEKLIEKLIFIEKVEKGIKQANEGKTISMDEARKRIDAKWSK